MTSENGSASVNATNLIAEKGEAFYGDAVKYWDEVEPTVNGMLGGLGFLSEIDIKSSEEFLKTLSELPEPCGRTYALDCGAGIGRITKDLLSQHFEKVDLVDQCPNFIEQAKHDFAGNKKIGEFFCRGLQAFNPPSARYDVIWMQWVLAHLTDEDLLQLLERCKKALLPGGVLVIKENCARDENVQFDSVDSSVTRPFALFTDLFTRADFQVVKFIKQPNFPANLFPVWTWAISPVKK